MAWEINAKFGANARLEVSMTAWKAGVMEKGVSLYPHIADMAGNHEVILQVPTHNVIYGPSHAGDHLAMQEITILTLKASSFPEAVVTGAVVYHNLKNVIKKKYGRIPPMNSLGKVFT